MYTRSIAATSTSRAFTTERGHILLDVPCNFSDAAPVCLSVCIWVHHEGRQMEVQLYVKKNCLGLQGLGNYFSKKSIEQKCLSFDLSHPPLAMYAAVGCLKKKLSCSLPHVEAQWRRFWWCWHWETIAMGLDTYPALEPKRFGNWKPIDVP